MRRRLFTPLLAVISLLTSCNNRPLRSDIAQFIASFSIVESRKNYQESGYERQDISIEKDGTIRVIETVDFNIKNLENIVYEYHYDKYQDSSLIESHYRHVVKENNQYFYIDDDEKVAKTSEEIISQHVTSFFYKTSYQELYYLGMYAGDYMNDIINDVQDYVSIDNENHVLIYDVTSDEKEESSGLTYEETWIIDMYGMTKSCNIHSTNGIVDMTTTILVYNVI